MKSDWMLAIKDRRPRMTMSWFAWMRHRRVVLNLRLWNRHLQVWLWGARVLRSSSGANCFRLDEFFVWRLGAPPKSDEIVHGGKAGT